MTSTWIERLAYRLLPLALALGVIVFLRVSEVGVAGTGVQSTVIALGFLLIGAFVGGKIAVRARLPRITGYLLVGLVVGPHLSGLLTRDMLLGATTVQDLAVALIALTAGGEIRLDWVRRQAKRLSVMTALSVLGVASGVALVVFVARDYFPFLPHDDLVQSAVIAMVFGAVAVASSPTVTIAVIAETRSEGPVTRTVLGVTILKDVAVIVLFASALTVARDVLGDGSGPPLGWTLVREVGGSIFMGLIFGLGIALFLRHVARDTPVFVLAVCFAMAEVSSILHLETLLVALTAGFWVENFSAARGDTLIKGIERVSLPVYALFFASAGAKVDLGALAALWPFALLLSGVRAGLLWATTVAGAKLSNAEPAVQRYGWLGFISQAGVTLALATIVARTFPGWGEEVQALIIAMIALHELIGPIGFQFALKRSKEVEAALEPGAASGAEARG